MLRTLAREKRAISPRNAPRVATNSHGSGSVSENSGKCQWLGHPTLERSPTPSGALARRCVIIARPWAALRKRCSPHVGHVAQVSANSKDLMASRAWGLTCPAPHPTPPRPTPPHPTRPHPTPHRAWPRTIMAADQCLKTVAAPNGWATRHWSAAPYPAVP